MLTTLAAFGIGVIVGAMAGLVVGILGSAWVVTEMEERKARG